MSDSGSGLDSIMPPKGEEVVCLLYVVYIPKEPETEITSHRKHLLSSDLRKVLLRPDPLRSERQVGGGTQTQIGFRLTDNLLGET